MNIIRQASELAHGNRSVCVAIGMFDGVHLGHQRILSETVATAPQQIGLPVAVTFDHHPSAVVAPERTPPLIYSLPQRLRAIESLGIEVTLLIHFDRAFSEQSAETFISRLARDFFQIRSICIGSSFTFGHQRSGNVALLKALGRQFGFTVHDLAAVSWDGSVVSSTRIRNAIQRGSLEAASAMLGRRYSVAGRVVPGEQLGNKLGFPTANLDVSGLALPPTGVYAGFVKAQGMTRQGVLNLGYRPTLNCPQPEMRFEVHLLDFQGDLYGREIEFIFEKKLRAEQKFASAGALQEQIGRDIAAARTLLA